MCRWYISGPQKSIWYYRLEHLVIKLLKYGIRGVVCDWVKSYLHDRTQFVQIEDIRSSFMEIKCGVPQGSVLG